MRTVSFLQQSAWDSADGNVIDRLDMTPRAGTSFFSGLIVTTVVVAPVLNHLQDLKLIETSVASMSARLTRF